LSILLIPHLFHSSCDSGLMPRASTIGKLASLIGATIVAAQPGIAVGAEVPRNPLRPASAELEPGDQILNPGPPAVPSTVVPPDLGQPELLPPPAGEMAIHPEGMDWQMIDRSASQRLVRPMFAEPWFAHGDPNDAER